MKSSVRLYTTLSNKKITDFGTLFFNFRGECMTLGNINFWEEFFLLKPKMATLESEIGNLQAGLTTHFVNEEFNEIVLHLPPVQRNSSLQDNIFCKKVQPVRMQIPNNVPFP